MASPPNTASFPPGMMKFPAGLAPPAAIPSNNSSASLHSMSIGGAGTAQSPVHNFHSLQHQKMMHQNFLLHQQRFQQHQKSGSVLGGNMSTSASPLMPSHSRSLSGQQQQQQQGNTNNSNNTSAFASSVPDNSQTATAASQQQQQQHSRQPSAISLHMRGMSGGVGPIGPAQLAKILSEMPLKERMARWYRAKNPEKLAEVDTLAERFKGREQQVLDAMTAKYGAEPPLTMPELAARTMSMAQRAQHAQQQAAAAAASQSMSPRPTAPAKMVSTPKTQNLSQIGGAPPSVTTTQSGLGSPNDNAPSVGRNLTAEMNAGPTNEKIDNNKDTASSTVTSATTTAQTKPPGPTKIKLTSIGHKINSNNKKSGGRSSSDDDSDDDNDDRGIAAVSRVAASNVVSVPAAGRSQSKPLDDDLNDEIKNNNDGNTGGGDSRNRSRELLDPGDNSNTTTTTAGGSPKNRSNNTNANIGSLGLPDESVLLPLAGTNVAPPADRHHGHEKPKVILAPMPSPPPATQQQQQDEQGDASSPHKLAATNAHAATATTNSSSNATGVDAIAAMLERSELLSTFDSSIQALPRSPKMGASASVTSTSAVVEPPVALKPAKVTGSVSFNTDKKSSQQTQQQQQTPQKQVQKNGQPKPQQQQQQAPRTSISVFSRLNQQRKQPPPAPSKTKEDEEEEAVLAAARAKRSTSARSSSALYERLHTQSTVSKRSASASSAKPKAAGSSQTATASSRSKSEEEAAARRRSSSRDGNNTNINSEQHEQQQQKIRQQHQHKEEDHHHDVRDACTSTDWSILCTKPQRGGGGSNSKVAGNGTAWIEHGTPQRGGLTTSSREKLGPDVLRAAEENLRWIASTASRRVVESKPQQRRNASPASFVDQHCNHRPHQQQHRDPFAMQDDDAAYYIRSRANAARQQQQHNGTTIATTRRTQPDDVVDELTAEEEYFRRRALEAAARRRMLLEQQQRNQQHQPQQQIAVASRHTSSAVKPSPKPVKPAAVQEANTRSGSPQQHTGRNSNSHSNEPVVAIDPAIVGGGRRTIVVVDRRTFAPNTKKPPHVPSTFDLPHGASRGAPRFGPPPATRQQVSATTTTAAAARSVSPPKNNKQQLHQNQQHHQFDLEDYERIRPPNEQRRHIPPPRNDDEGIYAPKNWRTRMESYRPQKNDVEHHHHLHHYSSRDDDQHYYSPNSGGGGRRIHDSHDPYLYGTSDNAPTAAVDSDTYVVRDVPRGAVAVKRQSQLCQRLSKPKATVLVVTGQ